MANTPVDNPLHAATCEIGRRLLDQAVPPSEKVVERAAQGNPELRLALQDCLADYEDLRCFAEGLFGCRPPAVAAQAGAGLVADDGFDNPDVFISYNIATQETVAKEIGAALRSKGICSYLAAAQIIPGVDWWNRQQRALQVARVLVLLIGKQKEGWVCGISPEQAAEYKPFRNKRPVIPVITHPQASVPGEIDTVDHINLVEDPASIERLCHAVRDHLQVAGPPHKHRKSGARGTTGQRARHIRRDVVALTEALACGKESQCVEILSDYMDRKVSVARIADDLVAPAFRSIGEGWHRRELKIYQERQACQAMIHTLSRTRLMIEDPAREAPMAQGGTPEGDHYSLPTALVELVLRQCGWQADSLGLSLPWSTLSEAVADRSPQLFWLSVSHIEQRETFLLNLRALLQAAGRETRVVIGGRALTGPVQQAIRSRCRGLKYDYCANLRDLEKLVQEARCSAKS